MEQTLGKRIAAHRKRLGLTQEQLAERMGVTPQAVSKWENDQSCPDISALPHLAEVFGITVDALLGRETPKPEEPEVVVGELEKDTPENDNEFHWEYHAGRGGAIVFALTVVAIGLLSFFTVWRGWDVSLWDIVWPCALIGIGVNGLRHRFGILSVGALAIGSYYLMAQLGVFPGLAQENILLPLILVVLGLGLLVSAFRKPKKHRTYSTNRKHVVDYTGDEHSFSCTTSFGEDRKTVTATQLHRGQASVNFGELTVDLSEVTSASEGCSLDLACSFGELRLLVPRRFRAQVSDDCSFGSVTVHGSPDANSQSITVHADCSFGNIEIRYI